MILQDGSLGRAAVPSGASTGSREAVELRDNSTAYGGKGVQHAVRNITDVIAPQLVGKDPSDQRVIDALLCELDGTENKARLGANAILAVSLACAKAAAVAENIPLYKHIAALGGTEQNMSLPLPMMNVMNGGAHAADATDIQEYMIIPKCANNFTDVMRIGTEVFHALGAELKNAGYPTTVGDEGGYAPHVAGGNREPLEHIMTAIEKAGYTPGKDVALALDIAASEFFNDGKYTLKSESKNLSSEQMIEFSHQLIRDFPIISIEDALDENDWDNWQKLEQLFGSNIQLVGDDLLVTNTSLLQKAINQKAANAILIKPNQIGTLSETIDAVLMAQKAGWNTIVSHRSGETEDTTVAHIAAGLGAGQIKTGSLSRSERLAKYNELLRIAESNASLQLARPFQ